MEEEREDKNVDLHAMIANVKRNLVEQDLLTIEGFEHGQVAIVRVVAAEIMRQVKDGCGVPSMVINYVKHACAAGSKCTHTQPLNANVAIPTSLDMMLARDGETQAALLHRNVRQLAAALGSLACTTISSTLADPPDDPRGNRFNGVVIHHESINWPARAWLAEGVYRGDHPAQGFTTIGEFKPLQREQMPDWCHKWWDLLPPECYSSPGRVLRAVGGIQ